MPPRIPVRGCLVFAVIAASVHLAAGQVQEVLRNEIGYTQLLDELGGPPGGGATLTIVKAEDPSWRWRRGDSEASNPLSAWRLASFTEGATWTTGQTSVGYADNDDNTELGDMQGNYSTVYLRRTFTLAAGQIPSHLVLRLYIDDGAIAWINGIEVARQNVSAGLKFHNDTAQTSVGDASWHDFKLTDAQTYLVAGTNVLAIHGLNGTLNSSDLSIDAELFVPPVTQVETTDNRNGGADYLPLQPPETPTGEGYQWTDGSAEFNGTTVEVHSFGGPLTLNQSPHGFNVAYRLLKNINSVAPDIDRVRAFETNDWVNGGFMRSDENQAPGIEYAFAQNHSWIGEHSAGEQDSLNRFLRRYDYAIDRDNFDAVVGVNFWFSHEPSPPPVPPLLGTAFHCISVGLSDGRHSTGGTVAPYDGTGRIKPEIVAPETAPSYSTAVTTASAALLRQLANFDPALANALNPEAIKAILMAGATKEEFPGWSRTPTQPLDSVYGSGELNVYNSYHILMGGEQAEGTGSTAAFKGWNMEAIPASGTHRYKLVVPTHAKLEKLSIVLTWHRQFGGTPWSNDFAAQPTLPNLDLRLYESDGGIPGTLLDSSLSTINNLEHLYALELSAGEYLIEIAADIAAEYAIAWRSAPIAFSPSFSFDLAGDDVQVFLDDLVTGLQYRILRSTDLTNWSVIHTFTGSELAETHLDIDPGDRVFYRAEWDALE